MLKQNQTSTYGSATRIDCERGKERRARCTLVRSQGYEVGRSQSHDDRLSGVNVGFVWLPIHAQNLLLAPILPHIFSPKHLDL